MFYPMYFDSTYMLVLIGVIICMVASAKMNATFNRYSRVRSRSGLTGREAAERILYSAGIRDVRVEHVPGAVRGSLVPIANFGSSIAWPLILIGLFMNSGMSALLLNLGILAFSLAVLFQIVTLPVEFNASGRAVKILGSTGILYEDEVKDTKKVLKAAALTYVAGAASAILQLLRIVLLANRRND